jgi:hypothetical protein
MQGTSMYSPPAKMATSANEWVATILSAIIILLVCIASAGGLWITGLYRDSATIVPALRGQDLVTLLIQPALFATILISRNGSTRAKLIWLGLLGYLLYTYLGAALGYYLNNFTLMYIAIFSLSFFAILSVLSSLDLKALSSKFDLAAPRVPVILFLLLIAFMLGTLELLENFKFIQTAVIPAGMKMAGGTNYFVYTLDLGLIVPLSVLSAWWLWQRKAWGFVGAGVMLIKASAMGLALLAMNLFSLDAGQKSDGLVGLWAFIALGGYGLSLWLFRHCHD